MINAITDKTVSHIRLPLRVAEETRAAVSEHLGVRVSTSIAVEWALKTHFLNLNQFDSPAEKNQK